jgi:hypothetical protein
MLNNLASESNNNFCSGNYLSVLLTLYIMLVNVIIFLILNYNGVYDIDNSAGILKNVLVYICIYYVIYAIGATVYQSVHIYI